MTVYYYPVCSRSVVRSYKYLPNQTFEHTMTSCLKDVKAPDNSVFKNQVEGYGNLSSAAKMPKLVRCDSWFWVKFLAFFERLAANL